MFVRLVALRVTLALSIVGSLFATFSIGITLLNVLLSIGSFYLLSLGVRGARSANVAGGHCADVWR